MTHLTERQHRETFRLLREKSGRLDALFRSELGIGGLGDEAKIRRKLQRWLDHHPDEKQRQRQQRRQEQPKIAGRSAEIDPDNSPCIISTSHPSQGGGAGAIAGGNNSRSISRSSSSSNNRVVISACSFELSDSALREEVVGALDALDKKVCVRRLGWILGEVAWRLGGRRFVPSSSSFSSSAFAAMRGRMPVSGGAGVSGHGYGAGLVGRLNWGGEVSEEEEECESAPHSPSSSRFWWSGDGKSGACTPDTEVWSSEVENGEEVGDGDGRVGETHVEDMPDDERSV